MEWLQCHVQIVGIEEDLVFNSQTNFMGQRKLLHHGKLTKVGGLLGDQRVGGACRVDQTVGGACGVNQRVGGACGADHSSHIVVVVYFWESSPGYYFLLPPLLLPPQVRGNKPLLGFLFNDFLLLAKPSGFFEHNMEPFKSGHFLLYRTVSVLHAYTWTAPRYSCACVRAGVRVHVNIVQQRTVWIPVSHTHLMTHAHFKQRIQLLRIVHVDAVLSEPLHLNISLSSFAFSI